MNGRITLLCLLGVLAACVAPHSSARRTSDTPAMVTFAAGGSITGDGYGATYQHNELNVSCVINDISHDLLLSTAASASDRVDPPRTLRFNFGNRVTEFCPTSEPKTPVPLTLDETAWMNVDAVGSIPVGSTDYRAVTIRLTIGVLHFGSATSSGSGFCSTPVRVQRTGDTTWVIEAESGVSDLAVLTQDIKGKPQPVGYYRMPFRVDLASLPASQ